MYECEDLMGPSQPHLHDVVPYWITKEAPGQDAYEGLEFSDV